VSFDLIVWALPPQASTAQVRQAQQRCHQGEHVQSGPMPAIVAFYRAITASYPDQSPRAESPWEVTPLHCGPDHIEMRMREDCADQVLLDIERLAAEHGLHLLDPQDGTVYPPPVTVAG